MVKPPPPILSCLAMKDRTPNPAARVKTRNDGIEPCNPADLGGGLSGAHWRSSLIMTKSARANPKVTAELATDMSYREVEG